MPVTMHQATINAVCVCLWVRLLCASMRAVHAFVCVGVCAHIDTTLSLHKRATDYFIIQFGWPKPRYDVIHLQVGGSVSFFRAVDSRLFLFLSLIQHRAPSQAGKGRKRMCAFVRVCDSEHVSVSEFKREHSSRQMATRKGFISGLIGCSYHRHAGK